MGYNLLGCGIEVNRLKRGGCLFEGIARREMEEYIIRTRGARSGLPSSEWIPNVWGWQSTRKGASMASSGAEKHIGPLDKVSDHFTVGATRTSMFMGRVFIVDDEEHVRKTVGFALKQGGYEVLEAADGEEAIAVIQSYPTSFSVHAIICDIDLPKVSGKDVIAFIRAKLPTVPVIVLTGYPDVQSAASLFRQGVVDYLIKPSQSQTLLDAVRRAIGEQELFE